MDSHQADAAEQAARRTTLLIEGLNGGSIFRLTRVTRIFQKKIFTETTPETTPAPGRHAAPGFLLREPPNFRGLSAIAAARQVGNGGASKRSDELN